MCGKISRNDKMKSFQAFRHCLIETKNSLRFRYFNRKDKWGKIGKGSIVHSPSMVSGRGNIFLGDNVNIDWGNTIYAVHAKFIMKDNRQVSCECPQSQYCICRRKYVQAPCHQKYISPVLLYSSQTGILPRPVSPVTQAILL